MKLWPLTLLVGAAWAGETARYDFARGVPDGWQAEGVEVVAGRTDQALRVFGEAKLSLPAPAGLTAGFRIELWVRHEVALAELRFEELVYLYHDTPDMKNRICLQKRIGTDEILFAMSDDTGPAKGAEFAGDWYAMVSGPQKWAAGTWHHLRIIADPEAGQAALAIDGQEVASARGTQFPKAAGTLWLGSWSGRSQARAVFDELAIGPARE